MSGSFQVVVAQKGAREHFLAARALHRRSQLAALVTDWYAPVPPALGRRLAALSPALSRALGAFSDELPRDRIVALNAFGLRSRIRLRRAIRAGQLEEETCRDDEAFARRVARLKLPPHQVLFAYSYAALEALQAARERGVLTVVDQIDPGRMEWDLVREETARWPEYAEPEPEAHAAYYQRALEEWRTADLVVVNSEWSRRALIRQGAEADRIAVIPLAYESAAPAPLRERRAEKGLTILWLGSVIIRKGIPYLVEVARQLMGEPVNFVVAGPLGIRASAVREAPPNMRWLGPVPRAEASRCYADADVFVLPTLSDGFAITQVEALAHGLPVIATPNCGAAVEDGRTGFIVPAGDAAALAGAIRRFLREPGLAARMREDCLAAAGRFSIAAFGEQLDQAIRQAQIRRGGGGA